MTNLNQHLKNGGHCTITCKDGLTLSIGYSCLHYCYPRKNGAESYEAVEVGFPSAASDDLLPFAQDASTPCDTVYPWTPVNVVEKVIDDHGGVTFVQYTCG